MRSLYHLLNMIHRPTQISPRLSLHRALLLPDGLVRAVTCRLQAPSASSVLGTKKMAASECQPELSCFLGYFSPYVSLGLSAMEKPIEPVSMPKSAAPFIALLLVWHACPSSAGIPCGFLISGRAGHPVFLFSSLTSATKILNLVLYGMKEEYLHRSTKKSTYFDKHTLSALTNLINLICISTFLFFNNLQLNIYF